MYEDIVQDLRPEVFLEAYLQGYSHHTTQWSPEELSLVSRIVLSNEPLYTHDAPLLCLLNSISRRIFHSRDNDGYALVFRSADTQSLPNPFTGNAYTPYIVVLREQHPDYEFPEIDYTQHNQVPHTWCAFSAVGEVKTGTDGKHQLGVYLQNLLQLHPELNAVLGLTVDMENYSLFYHDADVIDRSSFTFEQPGPLYAFNPKTNI
ncbi:unnamed protein product [Rhizoctonia solani]|uniref:Uncharacterized protein n=1 Tax=Rhizoctonia solani TaxID=456999 RepID=A0A8H3A7N6_9AGAM|nr:unnamed protein product [Rhizoctonia solani]